MLLKNYVWMFQKIILYYPICLSATLTIICYKIFQAVYVTAFLFHGRKHETVVYGCWHLIHSLSWWIVDVQTVPLAVNWFCTSTRLLFELWHFTCQNYQYVPHVMFSNGSSTFQKCLFASLCHIYYTICHPFTALLFWFLQVIRWMNCLFAVPG